MKGAFIRRLTALTRKEFYQLLRDKSSLLLGIVLPVALRLHSLPDLLSSKRLIPVLPA